MIKQKRLSNLMLLANFISGLFYATSYPYIYAETVQVIPRQFLALEQILCCISAIIFISYGINTVTDSLITIV